MTDTPQPAAQPVVTEKDPFLRFIGIAVAVIGTFYLVRKAGGTIVAAIAAFLVYSYREDLADAVEKRLKNGRH
jgi:hypothetical protein